MIKFFNVNEKLVSLFGEQCKQFKLSKRFYLIIP